MSKTEKPHSEFRGPGEPEWLPIHPGDGATDDEKRQASRNSERLKEALLSALQMQHIAVLAGSGCSLNAGGPSMRDLWDAIVGEKPSENLRELAELLRYSLTPKDKYEPNIEEPSVPT